MSQRHPESERQLWQATVDRVGRELAELPGAARTWLQACVTDIGALQQRLQNLFDAAGGGELCRDCAGGCCGCGRNHLTLANLLAILLAGDQPTPPDFDAPCPWLGSAGCRLAATRRPFNCVTFLCAPAEERLGAAGCREFYALERSMRALYQSLAERHPGAGLQGLLLRAEGLAGGGFFARE